MRYSFVGDTTYALFLYLSYATYEMIQNTTFYIGDNLKFCNLVNKIVMPPIVEYTTSAQMFYRIKCLKYRRQLSRTSIYAQDHLPFSAPLIDNLRYTLIEDCPNFFSMFDDSETEKVKETSIREKIFKFKVGRIYGCHRGYNPWCIGRLVTTEIDNNVLDKRNLTHEFVNIKRCWQEIDEKKKQYILKVFDFKYSILSSKRSIVIFSQPLMEDCHLSVQEHMKIYEPYIKKFGSGNILIKKHPRDNFDYEKYFPNIETLVTKAPQQLLSLLGMKFKIAITCCSSAVSTLDDGCEIIWIGAEIDKRIVRAYGHVQQPKH